MGLSMHICRHFKTQSLYSLPPSFTPSIPHTHTHIHTYTHSLLPSHTHTHTYTRTHIHTYTHIYTHTLHTHTHTHNRTFPSWVVLASAVSFLISVTVHLLNTSSATLGIFRMSLRRGVVIPPQGASVVLRNAASHLGLLMIARATALWEGGRDRGALFSCTCTYVCLCHVLLHV